MPWQSNGGGDNPNPWGDRPKGGSNGSGGRPGGGGGSGGEPPNFDTMIKEGQERLQQILPGGRGGIWMVIVALFIVWMLSGIYRVGTNEQAVVMQFGKYTETTGPGPHWHLPYPIETVEIRGVTIENTIEIGSDTLVRGRQSVSSRDESMMLTGDENIVEVKFNIVWKISDLGLYLFNLADPALTVKNVAASVMRERVGKNQILTIITRGREQLQDETRDGMQQTLDEYKSGIEILRVQISDSQAPTEVRDAFEDVQRAEADQKRFENEAEGYRERIVPEARGQAQRTLANAEAYAASVVAKAEGEAQRFSSVYEEYRQSKSVTRKRIYLETMEDILSGMDKIILDGEAGSGVVPYLPLNEVGGKKGSSSNSRGSNND